MKPYGSRITAVVNKKGVLDVDTVKGCELGMKAHPGGGCYGECYACKTAKTYGMDFTKSISRKLSKKGNSYLLNKVYQHDAGWYRIGTSGDPSHDWDNTIEVCQLLSYTHKTPVIITKHWIELEPYQIEAFADLGAVFNTSVSALDTDEELPYRMEQFERLSEFGVESVLRVVTCDFADTLQGRIMANIQEQLLSNGNAIDNPLRVSKSNPMLLAGDIIAVKKKRP